jgi:hypothetical protein
VFAAITADIDSMPTHGPQVRLGTESFDNWNTYVQTIQNLNIARAIEIQQAAVDRYNAS